MENSDLDRIYKEILKQVEVGMQEALDEGKRIAKEYMRDYLYGTYQPHLYKRLCENGGLLDAIKSRVILNGNNIIGELYIQEGNHPQSRLNDRSYRALFDFFAEGHGYARDGVEIDVINNLEELWLESNKALNIILNHLKSQGFNIK